MTNETATENRCLLRERRLVSERVPLHVVAYRPVLADGVAENGRRLAIVGQVDTINANGRVYPRAEWARNAERINNATAKMLGAVDHLGPGDGGNLKGSPIVWERLRVRDDGLIEGEFHVLDGHSAGRDFIAQIEAGAAIGFSTYGYAEAREPTADERELYGISHEQAGAGAVVIENWDLIKIDAVDNPAVSAAWLCGPMAAESVLNVLQAPAAEAVGVNFNVQAYVAEHF